MIKFFRKIRQKLLTENKFSKYLIYAIGEIILVVIGILIALQINNWNERRINRIEEVKVLKALNADFKETQKKIENTIFNQQNVVNYSKKLQSLITEKRPSDSIGEYLYNGGLSYWRIEPVNGTYDGLIGSGKIGVITNDILKVLLTEYSSELNYGFEDEKIDLDLTFYLTESTSNIINTLLPKDYQRNNGFSKTYSKNEIQKAQQKLIDNSSFSGMLITKTRVARNRLNYQKNILEYVIKIINEIESELNYLEK